MGRFGKEFENVERLNEVLKQLCLVIEDTDSLFVECVLEKQVEKLVLAKLGLLSKVMCEWGR